MSGVVFEPASVGRVEGDGLTGPTSGISQVQRGEHVAADAAVHRIDDAFHEGTGHRSVYGVAAAHQHLGARFDGKRLRGDDHSGHGLAPRWTQT